MQVTKQNKTEESTLRRYCSFRLAGRLYGVDIRDVKEINTEINFTPIFHATKEIKGYINIRGQIYLLLDPREIFGFPNKQIDESNRVVLFMTEVGDLCGILVDSIEDVVTVDESLIENRRRQEREVPEGIERRAADVGEGVCKLENELLIILDARRLVQAVRRMQIRQKIA
jgi:purine-binding chemotaxis protein CheW